MKFYEYDQNNSRGNLIVDDKVCHRIYIEADSAEEANRIAEKLGCYFNYYDNDLDCECCGYRWEMKLDDNQYVKLDQFRDIEEYAQYWANIYGRTEPVARIYYKNGTVREIYKKRSSIN